MKKTNFVITNIPTKLPINTTVLYSFLLYYFKVDNLYWGIFITLYLAFWIIAIISIYKETRINLNDESTIDNKFQTKLSEVINANKK